MMAATPVHYMDEVVGNEQKVLHFEEYILLSRWGSDGPK